MWQKKITIQAANHVGKNNELYTFKFRISRRKMFGTANSRALALRGLPCGLEMENVILMASMVLFPK